MGLTVTSSNLHFLLACPRSLSKESKHALVGRWCHLSLCTRIGGVILFNSTLTVRRCDSE